MPRGAPFSSGISMVVQARDFSRYCSCCIRPSCAAKSAARNERPDQRAFRFAASDCTLLTPVLRPRPGQKCSELAASPSRKPNVAGASCAVNFGFCVMPSLNVVMPTTSSSPTPKNLMPSAIRGHRNESASTDGLNTDLCRSQTNLSPSGRMVQPNLPMHSTGPFSP